MSRWHSFVKQPRVILPALCAFALAVVPACGDDSDGDGGSGGSGRGGSAGRGGSSGGAGVGGLAGSGGGTGGSGGPGGEGGFSGGTAGSGGSAGSAGSAGSGGSPGDAEAGSAVALNNGCMGCHTEDFGGSTTPIPSSNVYPRNLTPHATGLADWTDQEITRAIREGRDADGDMLCTHMPRFSTDQINATELRNLIAFLRSRAPVDRTIPNSTCGG